MTESSFWYRVWRNRRGKFEVNKLSIVDGHLVIMHLKSFSQKETAERYKKKMEEAKW